MDEDDNLHLKQLTFTSTCSDDSCSFPSFPWFPENIRRRKSRLGTHRNHARISRDVTSNDVDCFSSNKENISDQFVSDSSSCQPCPSHNLTEETKTSKSSIFNDESRTSPLSCVVNNYRNRISSDFSIPRVYDEKRSPLVPSIGLNQTKGGMSSFLSYFNEDEIDGILNEINLPENRVIPAFSLTPSCNEARTAELKIEKSFDSLIMTDHSTSTNEFQTGETKFEKSVPSDLSSNLSTGRTVEDIHLINDELENKSYSTNDSNNPSSFLKPCDIQTSLLPSEDEEKAHSYVVPETKLKEDFCLESKSRKPPIADILTIQSSTTSNSGIQSDVQSVGSSENDQLRSTIVDYPTILSFEIPVPKIPFNQNSIILSDNNQFGVTAMEIPPVSKSEACEPKISFCEDLIISRETCKPDVHLVDIAEIHLPKTPNSEIIPSEAPVTFQENQLPSVSSANVSSIPSSAITHFSVGDDQPVTPTADIPVDLSIVPPKPDPSAVESVMPSQNCQSAIPSVNVSPVLVPAPLKPEVHFVEPVAVREFTVSRNSPKIPPVINVKGISYKVFNVLGTGGSSVVYQVSHPETNELLAVKRVELSEEDDDITEGYLNEVSLLESLQNCDVIIRIFDHQLIQKNGKKILYVVMEKGDTDLSSLIRSVNESKKLSIPMIIYYWTEMLAAVNEVHRRGIIHSDLKPANFVLVRGRLKLIDFGIASSMQGDMTSVYKDSFCGTLNYMSPEATSYVRCPSGTAGYKITFKTDVWSLGCILYNLIYGHLPFHRIKKRMEKIHAIVSPTVNVEFPEKKNVPPILMSSLKSCLEKDYKRRPTVQELLDRTMRIFQCGDVD